MLDADLARIYGVTTTRLNQQVKRNLDRFPEDFMFQLTKDEFARLMLQNATSKTGRMVQSIWEELPKHYPGVSTDAFIAMPNHVHGILIVGAQFIAPDRDVHHDANAGVINHAPTNRVMNRMVEEAE